MSERDIDEAILAIALKIMGAPPGPLGFEFARALWQAALATRGPIGAVEPAAAKLAIEALEAAKNGLEWWNAAYAATDGSEADHEMIAQIDAAILALSRTPGEEA